MNSRVATYAVTAILIAILATPLTVQAKYWISDSGHAAGHHAVVQKTLSQQDTNLCPVTGAKADKSLSATYQGKQIYFCCANCEAPFMKNPGKYLGNEKRPTPNIHNGKFRL
jgi:YHS domain-containing protein